ncbi:uncharacterized protein LOC105280094 isoform X2 [Ooceraea biroi]|uniref:uncharacterized protein LOC105280094 isoform X2 n=1 Tax=Ooceraea biroi TaxID=2015173 RepID=UPI0005BC6A94|nr:uncharacterized protein LOC105280094 isoform X2 [Ooceraea biroi]
MKDPDVRIQKGLKPLEKKSFYLDIKNHATAAKLEGKIKELGGAIELFLVRSVTLVISDRVDKKTGHANFERHRWGCASGGSGGPRSFRSIEAPTPTPTPPTPLLSSECPSSNSTNLRGQTTQRSKSRVDAMLERALTQPQQCSVDPLDNAQSWGIPIWATDKLQAWLDRIYASIKDSYNLKQLKQVNQHKSINPGRNIKIKHLKGSYVKFESFCRTTRPVFLELSSWPTFNFDGDPGSCPFDTKKQGKVENKLINKEVKENKEDSESINKEEGKEMTRRPRATAARARRTEQLVPGYCEICRTHYEDLSKHMQSDQHVNFVANDDNFLSLDTLISTGANVEAFLKLNRTKDIEKDCSLFPNGDSNLHNVLPEEKITKNTKALSNFDVDEIKMVNGARRNLNLKLSSPHNLRARAKHESGHLLRSKGSPWHEVDKSDKLYNNKFEGFTIKKRSKGTIWIEEDEPDEKYAEDILKDPKQEDFKIKSFSKDIDEVYNKEDGINNGNSNPASLQPAIIHNNKQNGVVNSRHILEDPDYLKKNECNGDANAGALECNRINENGVVDDVGYTGSCKPCKDDTLQRDNCALQAEKVADVKKISDGNDANARVANEVVCNGYSDNKSEQKDLKVAEGENARCVKLKYPRANRRGRGIRGRCRQRLSVEERLIEDNRAYYKVEVLGNKLRSSAVPSGNPQQAALKDGDDEEKKEVPSSEKPVVVRFKRVRKSELSLLSDEAESFMFGEPKREDSSERTSDDEQSSVLPRDTDSIEVNEIVNSSVLSSSLSLDSSPVKQEVVEEDSQDSAHLGRARKRRRTQAEAFIKDNADYYKFETPGSRLRYQAPLTGIKDGVADNGEHATTRKSTQGPMEDCKPQTDGVAAKTYPSRPSAEIERMQFSFEAIPKSEPWYQTYQRQDTGTEFWHCFSECDAMKPFLLPYEIENFHEILMRHPGRIDPGRKRGRGRGIGCAGRSPRKSPRCHASTLAIMSTIIRKREQQQSSHLCTVEESPPIRLRMDTPRLEQKQDPRSDVDEELKEMARTIDEMLSAKGMPELDDSFEADLDAQGADDFCETSVPKGAPPNLLELLDNCQDMVNCLENNSSCANSECGDANMDIPLRRRKRRKNRTGWPVGNKMKKKMQISSKMDCEGESLMGKRLYSNEGFAERQALETSNRLSDLHAVTNSNVALSTAVERLSINQKSDSDALLETTTAHNICHEALTKKNKSTEVVNNDNMDNYVESSSISESTCNDAMNKSYMSDKDYPCRKNLSDIEDFSETDPGNDENHENQNLLGRKDGAISDRSFVAKSTPVRKRQREHVTVAATDDDDCESRDTEIENQDNLQLQCRKDAESGIVPRKHHNSNSELSTKRQLRGGNCEENPSSHAGELLRARRHGIVFATTRRGRMGSRRRVYSRKRSSRTAAVTRSDLSSSDHVAVVYDDENCKKDAYLSITSCNKKQSPSRTAVVRGVKRKSEAISSSNNIQELSEPVDQCALAERVSPPVISSTELEQRRSSMEFQPVVRMMKLDDQVDMDHSILSTVTVASNRRLRSSGGSSPSNAQPPKKRVKSGRGHFRRWLKSS